MTTNTYRVYVLSTTNPLAPTIDTVYVKAEKYGPAWQQARALCSGKQEPNTPLFTLDAEGTQPYTVKRDSVVAKVSDMTVRNVKLDKAGLQSILADASLSPEAKLEAMQRFVTEGKGSAPAPTPEPAAAVKGKKGAEAQAAA